MNTENIKTTPTEINIVIPEGMIIDEEKSTFTRIVFKPAPPLKPKWKDFGEVQGFFINSNSDIIPYGHYSHNKNINTWPTEEEAKASLALSQLCQWRDKYNEGWKPDYSKLGSVSCIIYHDGNEFKASSSTLKFPTIFRFKDAAIRDNLFEDFKELLEEAKPLLR